MILFLLWWFGLDIGRWILNKYNIIWNIRTNELCVKDKVYLTIDDVPTDNYFEEILDILDNFNIKATFFVISSQVTTTNKHLLIRAVKSGHHLANHGKLNKMHALYTQTQLLSELINCEQIIENIYIEAEIESPKIKYFRPGCGIVNGIIETTCMDLGYKIVLGSVYPSDTKLPFPNLLAWYIRNKTKYGDIIILHDRSHTSSTLAKSLPYLKQKYLITCLPN